MEKKLTLLFFYTVGICIFTPEVFAQVPAVSNPVCAYCDIKLTSSTKPWDHKIGCPYYRASSSSSSSSSFSSSSVVFSNKSSSASTSTQSIVLGGIASCLGSALNSALLSPTEKTVTTTTNDIASNYEVKIIDNGQYKKIGVWDKNRDKWYMSPTYWFNYQELYPQPNGEIIAKDYGRGFGVIIPNGQAIYEVIPLKNKNLFTWNGGGPYIINKTNRQWGLSDIEKIKRRYIEKKILPCIYDTVMYLGQKDIVGFAKNGKYGIAFSKRIIIPLKYDEIDTRVSTYQGNVLLAVKLNDKYGIIDTLDNVVIPFEYELLKRTPWVDNYYWVRKNGKYGAIDIRTNKIVIPLKYDGIGIFNLSEELAKASGLPDHLVWVKRDDKCGLLDFSNKMIIPIIYTTDKELEMQVMIYPQTSFNYYLQSLRLSEKKGEFETTAEYEARQKDPALQDTYLHKQMTIAEKDFIDLTVKNIKNPFVFKLNKYDADSETFEFVNYATPRNKYYLAVPRSEAEAFKVIFDSIKEEAIKTTKCFIDEDAVSIAEVTFTTPEGKNFKYKNPACKGSEWPVPYTEKKIE